MVFQEVMDQRPLYRASWLFAAIASAAALPATVTGQTFHYRTYMPVEDSTLWHFAIEITNAVGSDSLDVIWRSESGDGHRHEYRVDEKGNAGRWSVVFPERNTAYQADRQGDELRVRGQIEGEVVDEVLEVRDALLFANVGIGLSLFARSGEELIEFAAFTEGDRALVRLDAQREGLETELVDGRPVQVIRVRWAARGWRGWFYERYSWFRVEDGILVRTDERDGRATELLSVSGTPFAM